jgi:copper resistance protein C
VTQRRRWLVYGLVVACITLGTVPRAFAHAFLNASVPSADSTVAAPLREISLSYSQPVEIRFSIFKVYKLNAAPGTDIHALHAAADSLVSADLLKRGDEADRSDAGVANTTRTSADIIVRLKNLDPGAYVLMWHVLSVDTHTTQGSFIFVYTPSGLFRPVAASIGPGDDLPRLWLDEGGAQAPTLDAPLGLSLQALQPAAPAGQDPPNIQVSGVLMYRYFNAPIAPVAGGANLNVLTPVPGLTTLNDGIAEAAITWTFSPTVSLFADLSLESTTGVDGLGPSDIEQAYFDIHNLFGLPGSGIRLGRERIKLGFTGLLLDETVFDGGRRDGVEVRASQLGSVSLSGSMQFALDNGLQVGNWPSTRRVWGGHAEVDALPGWPISVSYRADTAGSGEIGPCPGVGCNVGNGFSVGVQGDLTPGVNLIVEAATYTRLGDVSRWYYEPSLEFDLHQLFGVQALQPMLTFWYKNFDPYTPPLDAPLGGLLIPGDFAAFNTNDNLTAAGARLDLSITPALSAFALGEWGSYKGGGPSYNVFSIGLKLDLRADTSIKASYNSYQVGGGVVTTSPVSGLQLSNAQIIAVELTRSF